MFWITGGILTALTALALVATALRRRSNNQFHGRAQAVFADQLVEVDRDADLGLISETEAGAARIEIKRRMLGAAKHAQAAPKPQGNKGLGVLIVAALFVPVVGVGTYVYLGNPQLQSIPFADRQAERDDLAQMDKLLARLRDRLESDEESPVEGWLLLAQSYKRLSRHASAVWAYSVLIGRGEAESEPEIYVLYAESMIEVDDGIVTPKSEAAIDRALVLDPINVAAIFYKSIALEQSGELEQAFAMLRDRIALETSNLPWMESLAGRANFLAAKIGADPVETPAISAGPTQADIAAASDMSDEDREAFIRSMVGRLAARLKDQPDDLDGWLNLARAYTVLGEGDKATDAFKEAGKLASTLPADDPRRAVIAEGLNPTPQTD